jgi:hypothetical protein
VIWLIFLWFTVGNLIRLKGYLRDIIGRGKIVADLSHERIRTGLLF